MPTMSAAVMATTSRRGFQPAVYAAEPEVRREPVEHLEEVLPGLGAEERRALRRERREPSPIGGTGLPVSIIDTKIAGMR